MMEKVEKVSVAHAGASYNPDYDDHQALLLQEHNKEFKKVKSEDSYKEKAKPKSNKIFRCFRFSILSFRRRYGGRNGERINAWLRNPAR